MTTHINKSGQAGRVFISHSSKDKPFVRKLVGDLNKADLKVWIDERELGVGDSIVAGIEDGLKDTDYLVIVLSEHSARSQWVRAELDAALMDDLSGGGTVVLPVRIDDCEIPPLLKPRVYADFRSDYDAGLAQLLMALDNEARSGSDVVGTEDPLRQPVLPVSPSVSTECTDKLAELSLGDLMRRMCERLERGEVADVWFDTFGGDQMDDDYPDRPKNECVRGLIDRARKRRRFSHLLRELCKSRPDLSDDDPVDIPEPPRGEPASGPPQIATTRLHHGADHLFGREKELAQLNKVRDDPAKHLMTIVAFGGVGKTSLVIEWMARQAAGGWTGFERVFDWSFYSQGTREQGAASADVFVAKALAFFGDAQMAKSAASPWDKGARLARLVAQRPTLLVLDGLEPLQHPPGPLAGKLKDPALEALLKGLAQHNPGLCLVTTRERVTDLTPFRESTAAESDLEFLSEEAGAALLHRSGARRAGAAEIAEDDAELIAASREVEGHALTLRLLGNYLALIDESGIGDIRKRDSIEFEDADAEFKTNPKDADKPYGHAFKVMMAYEKWLASGGAEGARQLAALRLMGLFDRPANADCLAALRNAPAIRGLTRPLVGLSDARWQAVLNRLGECDLISPPAAGAPKTENRERQPAVDAHPLIREYFATQLRKKNRKAWQAAHRRLYEHLKDSTEHQPDTLEGLQPLYQAVAHGCQAGLQREACDDVYQTRILRGNEFYSTKKLGADGADLGAVACFFDQPWCRVSAALSDGTQAWLLNEASFSLRALGRLTEALEPMRVAMDLVVDRAEWKDAAIGARNSSELKLTLGDATGALRDAERSVEFADRSGDEFERMTERMILADALHQAGRRIDALARFGEGEAMQGARQPGYTLLYSVRGFRYCDLLLAECERAAWQRAPSRPVMSNQGEDGEGTLTDRCREVEQRAAKTLTWAEAAHRGSLLDIALDHLSLGRAALYRAVLTNTKIDHAEASETSRRELTAVVGRLRNAGRQDFIPHGLLSRAWLRFLAGDADGARADLDEAWQIAERGPMRLHMTDIHLHRARLFHAEQPYPWESPRHDLAEAERLIAECGYHRRDEELADAQQAAETW